MPCSRTLAEEPLDDQVTKCTGCDSAPGQPASSRPSTGKLRIREPPGAALEKLFDAVSGGQRRARLADHVSASGIGGTLASGKHLEQEPGGRIVTVEATECPTLLCNGSGEHDIRGIGDKHIPYIHNLPSTDMVVGISGQHTDCLPVPLNTAEGCRYPVERCGIPAGLAFDDALATVGIDGQTVDDCLRHQAGYVACMIASQARRTANGMGAARSATAGLIEPSSNLLQGRRSAARPEQYRMIVERRGRFHRPPRRHGSTGHHFRGSAIPAQKPAAEPSLRGSAPPASKPSGRRMMHPA